MAKNTPTGPRGQSNIRIARKRLHPLLSYIKQATALDLSRAVTLLLGYSIAVYVCISDRQKIVLPVRNMMGRNQPKAAIWALRASILLSASAFF